MSEPYLTQTLPPDTVLKLKKVAVPIPLRGISVPAALRLVPCVLLSLLWSCSIDTSTDRRLTHTTNLTMAVHMHP